jgi:hypothetical protein
MFLGNDNQHHVLSPKEVPQKTPNKSKNQKFDRRSQHSIYCAMSHHTAEEEPETLTDEKIDWEDPPYDGPNEDQPVIVYISIELNKLSGRQI